MTKCNFCGKEESPYKGVHLIKNDGSTNFYCSSKCRRNALNLKRDKNKFKWTEAYGLTRQRAIKKEKREAEDEAKKALKTEEKEKKNETK